MSREDVSNISIRQTIAGFRTELFANRFTSGKPGYSTRSDCSFSSLCLLARLEHTRRESSGRHSRDQTPILLGLGWGISVLLLRSKKILRAS
jgi:hypothetical protein